MPAKRNDTAEDRHASWSRIELIWDRVFPMGSIKFLASEISASQYKKISACRPVGEDVMVKVANILGVPVREIDPRRRKDWTKDIDSVIQDAIELKSSGGGLMNSPVEVANLICQALHIIYVQAGDETQEAIKEMGATREQFAAMAITEKLMEHQRSQEDGEDGEGDFDQE